MDDSHELGVGSCSMGDVRLVQSFVDDTVFARHPQKPHVYFNECEKEVAPHEDRHTFVTKVTLDGQVSCRLTFFTGHYDQESIFHADAALARIMVKKCRGAFLASKAVPRNRIGPNQEVDLSNLSSLYELDEESEPEVQALDRSFRDAASGEPDRAAIDEIISHPTEGFEDAAIVFTDKNTGEVNYDEFAALFDGPEFDYKDVSNVVRTADSKHTEDSLVPFHHSDDGAAEEHTGDNHDDEEESMLLGGFMPCDHGVRMDFFNILIHLGNSRVFKPIFIYDENLKSCSSQVVNGINYAATLSINGDLCDLQIYTSFDRSVVELTNADQLAAKPECASYLTYEYSQLVANAHKNK